jgi:hypothetical protein
MRSNLMGEDVTQVQNSRPLDGDTATAVITPTSAAEEDGLTTNEHSASARGGSHVAVARSIYGLLIVMTVLEAMEIHPPHAGWAGPELLAGTLVAVALAEVYSDVFAGMFVQKKRLCRDDLRHLGRETAPLLIGLPLPVGVLVLSALGLVGIHHAIDAAQIMAYATLLFCGWWLARNLGARQAARVAGGVTMFAIAFALVALKAAFH